jgi:hypothetical protein
MNFSKRNIPVTQYPFNFIINHLKDKQGTVTNCFDIKIYTFFPEILFMGFI